MARTQTVEQEVLIRGRLKKVRLNPLKAIRYSCLNCMCGSYKEIKLCTSPTCSLYGYRLSTL